ncbi:WD repeat-containing protein 11-like [Gigantopelta aegis]|uniref:WD repeat-containing protein 11-like n=1 Tax=Gigantopelta aegis TaxID=1735272 RepID=UPI001B88D66B|nr:WD repeat-containing protein 11-like [Gigantopelta aegis]
MKLFPKTITGSLHAQNKGACDWGWQGLFAYGSQNFVSVVDPVTVQVIQVLHKHKANVIKIKWAKEDYHHDVNSPYCLRLASADASGNIIAWDVSQGHARAEFSDGNKPVQDMDWLGQQDASRDLLVALHPPYSLILWNADTGTRLWKKTYTETLISFSFDRFNSRNVVFLGQDCIVFIDDFMINKTPSSNGKKYYIFSPSSHAGGNSANHNTSANNLERKASSKNLAQRMSRILVGESKPSKPVQTEEETVAVSECLQLSFHPSCRHHIILLYPREMLILDLEINQTVGMVSLDKTSSPFVQVLPCWQRDVLMCLHESGSISVRIRRKSNNLCTPASEGTGAFDDTPPTVSMDVAYDLRSQTDPLRVTRHNRVYGFTVSPVSERTIGLVMSDSRVIFWEMKTVDVKSSQQSINSPLFTPGATLPSAVQNVTSGKNEFPVITGIPYPKMVLTDMIGPSQLPVMGGLRSDVKGHSVQLKFIMTGLLQGVHTYITCIRMCPPLTNKNWTIYEPRLALGTFSGAIQTVNVASGQVDREFSIHSSMVRGIEWCGLKTFLSYAYPNPGPSGLVKNEFSHVDILSGKVTHIRLHREEESPLESMQISHLKQFFVLGFKDKPLELWDLKSLTIIRELPKTFPRPTAIVWSPSHSLKTMKKKLLDSGSDDLDKSGHGSRCSEIDTSTTSSGMSEHAGGKEKKTQSKMSVREHFVMTDKDGTVFHFIVEGNLISDVTKIPPDSGLSTVTCLAWKGDFLVFGDVDGTQCLWDLKAKISRTTPSSRGWIKKIRFAPGRENFKFFTLHNDGLVVWDINQDGKSEIVHFIKSPKDIAKIVDAEWAGSDRPCVVTTSGCVHVFDLALKIANSSIEQWDLQDPLMSPYLLPPKASQLLKCILQHQPWTDELSFELDGMREDDQEIQRAVNTQLNLIDSELLDYLRNCQFGTAQRCLLTARIFGDESELHFWTVALHYLRSTKVQSSSKSPSRVPSNSDTSNLFVPQTPDYKETNDLVLLDNPEEIEKKKLLTQLFRDQPLERCYDAVVDNQSFKKYQLDRVSLHDSKRSTYDHTQKCAENYMLLGQTDRAVQLLLETEADNENYYIDSLRACLVASIRSSGASQSTIKLVATNLIANGKLSEGVQLLCLIDKGLDACRYLQTYGSWDKAVWLAKSSLNFAECSEVIKRWADHLCSTQVNHKSKALLVLLSLGQFVKVVEMLYGMRSFDRAACFIEACLQFGVLEKTSETASLIEAVFLEYARFLTNIGLRKAAEYYCNLAGDKGEQFLKEVEILFT